MRIGDYFVYFEHDSVDRWSSAALYHDESIEPVAEVHVDCYYKDRWSRKGGRRACMQKLLSSTDGPFAGPENYAMRSLLWDEYWKAMPQDLKV